MRKFLKSCVGALLCVFSLCIISIPTLAKTIEIKSENFVLVGRVRESDGKALLLELEQYRQAILQLLGATNPLPEIVPVRIYTVGGDKDLKLLTGRTDIGGVYKSTIEGPIFILNAKSGFRRGKQARHIALHEYTHHLLASYSNQVYPRWYNEGLANYFSTFEVNKKGDIIIGRPYNPYGYPLSQKKWMPTKVLVNSVLAYPYRSTGKSSRGLTPASYFYAQSWLAVHYIQSTKGESVKLRAYIKLLNEKRGVANAYETAFGRTPEEFELLLRAYYKKNRFSIRTITLKTKIKDFSFQVTELDKGTAEFHKAEAMRFFSSSFVKTEDIVKQYDKAASKIKASGKIGETAAMLSARADLATWDSDYAKAQAYIKQALALAPDNAGVLRTAGMVLLYENEAADSPDGKALDKAREYLKKAMIKNPDDIGAHYYYARCYAVLRERPSAQATASALTALDYYRAINFVETNLSLAGVLLKGGQYKQAEPVIDKAIIWSRQRGARMSARSMKTYIKNKRK